MPQVLGSKSSEARASSGAKRAMPKVLISLGSNLNREQNIQQAIEQLSERFAELTVSAQKETPDYTEAGAPYLNVVVAFETAYSPWTVRSVLKQLENDFGRDRSQPAKVSLDADLLQYGDKMIHTDLLKLPSDDMQLSHIQALIKTLESEPEDSGSSK